MIVSSSLAQDSHFLGLLRLLDGNFLNAGKSNSSNATNATNTNTSRLSQLSQQSQQSQPSSCQDPCAELQHVTHTVVLLPLGIALMFFLVGALPVLLFRSRYRVHGVRSCLWVLVGLWLQLVVTFAWFSVDRAQAYAWALHASTYVLASWRPRDGVMPHPGLQRAVCLAGAWCVSLFAWQFGPPIGLAAWYRSSDALCGWKVHLTAVVGVELFALGLGLFEGAVTGLG